ncbi:leucine-rich repeat-containing protein 36 isoform X2 [Protopterus annectens]|nr:leucine-rich repeat-containing protein 36 isoform X2 [Protopterus annectens]
MKYLRSHFTNLSKQAKENGGHKKSPNTQPSETRTTREVKDQNDAEEDYRPLPSPTRSSLRVPGKNLGRTKDGFRVTFAENQSSEPPQEKKTAARSLFTSDIYQPRDSTASGQLGHFDPRSLLPSKHNLWTTAKDYRDSQHISTSTKEDYLKTSSTNTASHSLDARPYGDVKKTYQSSFVDLLKHQIDKVPTESSIERLQKLSSDLYVTTHLDDEPLVLDNQTLKSDKPSTTLTTHNHFSSTEALLEKPYSSSPSSNVPYYSIGGARNVFLERGKQLITEKPPRSKHENHSAWTSEDVDIFSPRTEMKRTSSLTLLPSKSFYEQNETEKFSGKTLQTDDLRDHTSWLSAVRGLLPSSDTSIVLSQLLDLVDRYWNGSRSLHLNQKFLTPAQELLTSLTRSTSSEVVTSYQVQEEKQIKTLPNEDRSLNREQGPHMGDMQDLKEQLMDAKYDLDCLRLKFEKITEENNILKSKLQKAELPSKNNSTRNQSDFASQQYPSNEQLFLRLGQLSEQLKQSVGLQETINMLKESHRSLISTNDYLLMQLNKTREGNNSELSNSYFGSQNKNGSMDRWTTGRNSTSQPPSSSFNQYNKLDNLTNSPL